MTSPSECRSVPLCVDLDGTLIRSDLLYESFARLLKHRPWLVPLAPFWILQGRAVLKRKLADRVTVDVTSLPYNAELVEWLRREKAAQREILLVTAADESFARQVAEHVGLFDRVIASDGRRNLKGARKLQSMQEELSGGFEYAGNDWSDLEIWRHSANAVAVCAPPSLLKRLREFAPGATVFEGRGSAWRSWPEALRVRRWVKNLLVFLPLLTAPRSLEPGLLLECLAGFFLLSFCSSSQYILNDLVDLESDRLHGSKGRRPFASGDLPIVAGLFVAPVLLGLSLGIALLLNAATVEALAGYFVLSLSYSLYLKRVVLLGAISRAGLNTLRIIVGYLATGIALPVWLLAVAFVVFLCLDRRQSIARSSTASSF